MPDSQESLTQATPDMLQVQSFRSFNRFYTRQIGTLDESLLQTGYSLTEARLLYELASRKSVTAAAVAEDLRLDPGYLSRLVTRLCEAKLIRRSASPNDNRQVLLTLTRQGKLAFASLNRRSNRQIAEILRRLTPAKRLLLLRAMRTVEETLAKETSTRAYVLRPHRSGDMGWIVHRHGLLYRQEYGWDERFEALVARITADFIEQYDEQRERCWIAERDGESLGSVFLVKHPELEGVAKLRLLLVEPGARGLGLGAALVRQCTQFARQAQYQHIMLWTNSVLSAARHIYQQEGYRLTQEEPHRSFGKDLIGQTWQLDLTAVKVDCC